jgi:hypothetical protein
MNRIFVGLMVATFCATASAQNLVVEDLPASKAFLLKTYGDDCQGLRAVNFDGMICAFNVDPGKPDDFVRIRLETTDTGPGASPRYRRQVSIRVTPGVLNSDAGRNKYLELARQITLPDGGTLAEKLPTPTSVDAFCKNSPDADKSSGCTLDETARPNVNIGLFVQSDKEGLFVSVLEKYN